MNNKSALSAPSRNAVFTTWTWLYSSSRSGAESDTVRRYNSPMLAAGLVVGSMLSLLAVPAQGQPPAVPRPGAPVAQPPTCPAGYGRLPLRPRQHRRRSAYRGHARRARVSGRTVHRLLTMPDVASGTTLFGTPASFVDLVAYYRTMLKQRGDLVCVVPATHQFDVGRLTMTRWRFLRRDDQGLSVGPVQRLSQPKAGRPAGSFPTIIQIVAVPRSDRVGGRAPS